MSHDRLVFLTHSQFPWNNARKGLAPFEYTDKKISLDDMYNYYSELQSNLQGSLVKNLLGYISFLGIMQPFIRCFMTRIMKLILKNDLLPFFPKSDWFDAQVSLDRILELCKTRDVYPGHGEMVMRE